VGALLLLPFASALTAQAVMMGTAIEDSTRRPLAGVEVILEGTKKQTTTDGSGRFLLNDLPTGNKVILFRSVGYRPQRVRVMLNKNDTTRVEAVLISDRVRLEPIVVTGAPDRPRGIGREAFEERRRLGFGKFIDTTELRHRGYTRMSDVLASLGVHIIQHQEGNVLEMRAASSRRLGQVPCWMGVILDGVTLYKAVATGTVSNFPPPDFRKDFSVDNIEAIEVYRSASEVPMEFGGNSASCGVIVLWTTRGKR
jgi:TonB-dependent starch-binding outer membrane protein SusC